MAFVLNSSGGHGFVGHKVVSVAVLYHYKPFFANANVLAEVLEVSVVDDEVTDPFKVVFLVALCYTQFEVVPFILKFFDFDKSTNDHGIDTNIV